jgi:hypothetical protein
MHVDRYYSNELPAGKIGNGLAPASVVGGRGKLGRAKQENLVIQKLAFPSICLQMIPKYSCGLGSRVAQSRTHYRNHSLSVHLRWTVIIGYRIGYLYLHE